MLSVLANLQRRQDERFPRIPPSERYREDEDPDEDKPESEDPSKVAGGEETKQVVDDVDDATEPDTPEDTADNNLPTDITQHVTDPIPRDTSAQVLQPSVTSNIGDTGIGTLQPSGLSGFRTPLQSTNLP